MRDRVDIVHWLRDLRHSPAVREIGDVGRGLHLAEAEITRLRAEVDRLRNGAVSSRETVQPAATTVDAAAVDAAPVPKPVAAQPPTCDGTRQPFDSASTTDHDAAPSAKASLPTADHAVCRGRESGCGTGDTTREPVMYALQFNGDPLDPEFVFSSAEEAENFRQCTSSTTRVVRLYGDRPPPALTDAEREALVWSIKECEREAVIEQSRATTGNYLDCALRECQAMARASTLRALLARHGGER